MTSTTEHAGQDVERHPVRIHVTVNTRPVTLTERRMTGLDVKQAAIVQGVAIDVDFQLSVKRGHRFEVVGDTDPVTIREGQEFIAVAKDDNS
jgi:hypothetical protein